MYLLRKVSQCMSVRSNFRNIAGIWRVTQNPQGWAGGSYCGSVHPGAVQDNHWTSVWRIETSWFYGCHWGSSGSDGYCQQRGARADWEVGRGPEVYDDFLLSVLYRAGEQAYSCHEALRVRYRVSDVLCRPHC